MSDPDSDSVIDALTRAATVHLSHRQDDSPMWGSGFFVAPGWVLTCAHVLAPTSRATRP